MIRPYLIQSARFDQDDDSSSGIDDYVRWNYMGSAEYEFGALGEAWRRLKRLSAKLVMTVITINSHEITIVCLPTSIDDVVDIVTKFSKDRYAFQLKEFINFHTVVADTADKYIRENLWFDIDNDYMFWIDNPEFKETLTTLLNEVPSEDS